LALPDEAVAAFLGAVEADKRRFSHACWGKPGA
jgi:hypothetical protein